MADNYFSNCNVKPGGNVGGNDMGARGECYHGSDPAFMTEFYNNTLETSGGITLSDAGGPTPEWECKGYVGPWIRFSVMRSNVLSGISEAVHNRSTTPGHKPACAATHVDSRLGYASRAVVAEQSISSCPLEGNASSGGYQIGPCHGCMTRL